MIFGESDMSTESSLILWILHSRDSLMQVHFPFFKGDQQKGRE